MTNKGIFRDKTYKSSTIKIWWFAPGGNSTEFPKSSHFQPTRIILKRHSFKIRLYIGHFQKADEKITRVYKKNHSKEIFLNFRILDIYFRITKKVNLQCQAFIFLDIKIMNIIC